jgi:hypothetical protein
MEKLVKSKDAFYLVVVPKEGSETEGIKSFLIEAEKLNVLDSIIRNWKEQKPIWQK